MSFILLIADLLIQLILTAKSFPEADRIINLPGQPSVSFHHYAGYITVNDENQPRALFYHFVEAETDPASKPLVLWLNGGPGCSSVGAGAFCEHGPFKPSGDILVKNEYSWNKEANMLYLESPAGVGFSYSANTSFYTSVNDEMTARDNLAFLDRWLAKFPQYKNSDLFITGESYGGHYVPQLAELVTQSINKFNLKGIAIGNPLLEYNTDFNSRAEFFWSHGLISDATYEALTSVCNYSQYRRERDSGSLTPVCSAVMNQVSGEISSFVDVYDVSLDVCLSSFLSQSKIISKLVKLEFIVAFSFLNFIETLVFSVSSVDSVNLEFDVQESEEEVDVCVEDRTVKYLNREDVQKAFHAQLVGITAWTVCSDVLKYKMQDLEIPTIHILGRLVNSGIRVWVYSGDQDSVIPLIGTRILINGLAKKLGLNTTVAYRAWFEGRQVAGWTQVYGDVLAFSTIRGGSHEAPFSQPQRSLALFKAFLEGNSLPEALFIAEQTQT